MGERRCDESSRFDEYEKSKEFSLISGIAEALREEFGVGIDAHPGGEEIEAGVVNRAFRAAVRRSLRAIIISAGETPHVIARAVRLAARRNLAEKGLSDEQAEGLLDTKPGLGD